MNLRERLHAKKSPSFLEKPRIDKSSLDVHQVIAEFVKQEMRKMFEPVTAEVIKSLNVERLKKSVTPLKGTDYEDGEDGRDGVDGRDGAKGEKGDTVVGPRGPKGEDGKSIVGPAGKDGTNGSPDTPKQIVDKTNEVGGVL